MDGFDDISLKTKTARTVKWNLIDRVGSQLLYALTGIVLARELSEEEFGLVGAVLVFQAFATLLVDSGFAWALLQRKAPTRLDYSSVLWFNMAMAVMLYVILWFCAPAIADFYKGDVRIIPLARVIFLSLIINAAIIVQTNILNKRMDVGKIAMSNASGLVAAAVVGITLAVHGYGAWAIVWQTLTLAAVKTITLWSLAKWWPMLRFSWKALCSYLPIASRMMATAFLNVLFQNIYSLVIGYRVSMTSLGYYTQSDKWSKMSITTVTQTLTSSFMPPLSHTQDDPERFSRLCSRFNRFTAYVLFPLTVGPIVLAEPIFHALFGTKWDPSIILFQLLIARGAFTVLCTLYNNYLLAKGNARAIMWLEVLRDVAAVTALVIALPGLAYSTPDNVVAGLTTMLWWQLGASALTWVVTLVLTVRTVATTIRSYLRDLTPYLLLSLITVPLMMWIDSVIASPFASACVAAAAAAGVYYAANLLLGSKIQREIFMFLRKGKL